MIDGGRGGAADDTDAGNIAGDPAPGETIAGADGPRPQQLDPRTPLTMMRSVQESISRDRTEIDGARRPLFRGDGAGDGDAADGPPAEDAQTGPPVAPTDREDPVGEEAEAEEEGDDPYAALSGRAVPHPDCVPYGSEVTVRLRNPGGLLTLRVRRPGTAAAATAGALGKRSVFLGGEDDDCEFFFRFELSRDPSRPA